ncbi:MAG: hypothetical protein ACW99Q_23465, partial [Candidatus Kariarchaeaceae archaeon]
DIANQCIEENGSEEKLDTQEKQVQFLLDKKNLIKLYKNGISNLPRVLMELGLLKFNGKFELTNGWISPREAYKMTVSLALKEKAEFGHDYFLTRLPNVDYLSSQAKGYAFSELVKEDRIEKASKKRYKIKDKDYFLKYSI